jgi:hypothetical protein
MPNDQTIVTPNLTEVKPTLVGTDPAVVVTPVAFVPDATKSAEENATAKTAFDAAAAKATEDKAAVDKVAADKLVAENKTAEEKAAAAKANDTKANPLKMEEIKIPDGMTIDEPVMKGFVEIVNKFGLGRDAVAELTTLQANAMKNVSEAGNKLYSEMQDKWRSEATADPDIGGERLASTLGGISKLVDKYGSPELRGVLDLTGAGNNPHVIKFLNGIYKQLGEGHFVAPGAPSLGGKTSEEIMFPNQGKP